MSKKSAIERRAVKPDRTHSAAIGCHGPSTVEFTRPAESSTTPAAVIHERSGLGERKKLRTPNEVCVSSTSANHSCHDTQRSSRSYNFSIRYARRSRSNAEGGEPARASRWATSTSRLENAE